MANHKVDVDSDRIQLTIKQGSGELIFGIMDDGKLEVCINPSTGVALGTMLPPEHVKVLLSLMNVMALPK